MNNWTSRVVHSAAVRRLAPEWSKELYRRLRDAAQRARYNPKRFWTKFGETYMGRFPPGGSRHEELLIGALASVEAKSVLDVGCGYGRYLLAARRSGKFQRLCGVDISDTQIAQARQFLKEYPEIELHVRPATDLPFPEASFDAVLTYSLMIHLRPAEAEKFLSEAARVCAGWGVFLESSSNPDRPWLNPPYYFAHEYEPLFARHGMRVERKETVNAAAREYLYVVRLSP